MGLGLTILWNSIPDSFVLLERESVGLLRVFTERVESSRELHGSWLRVGNWGHCDRRQG